MTLRTGHVLHRAALDATLAELLAAARARVARLVDGRTGEVLGSVGWSGRDDVEVLARLAGLVHPVAAADGGLDDVVVSAARAVHVARPAPFGTVLVLRLEPGADVGAARRELTHPRLAGALHAALSPAPAVPVQRGPGPQRPLRAVPTPRAVRPVAAVHDDSPALAALSAAPAAARTGQLAALALAAIEPASGPGIPLPRRGAPTPPPPDGVLATAWSRDLDTMRRLLDGLRRLA